MRTKNLVIALAGMAMLLTAGVPFFGGEAQASGATFVNRDRDPAESKARVVEGPSVILRGVDNTLSTIAADIGNPAVFSYDAGTGTAVCKANLVIEFGGMLTLQDETLTMDGPWILIKHGGEIFMDSSTITASKEGPQYQFRIYGTAVIRKSTVTRATAGRGHAAGPIACDESIVSLRDVKFDRSEYSDKHQLVPGIPILGSAHGTLETEEPEGAEPTNVQAAEYIRKRIALMHLYLEPKFDFLAFDLDDLSGRLGKREFGKLSAQVDGLNKDTGQKAGALETELSSRAESEPMELLEVEDPQLLMAQKRKKYLGEINKLQEEIEGKIAALRGRLGKRLARLPVIKKELAPIDEWLEQTFHRGFCYNLGPWRPVFPTPVPDGYEGFPAIFRYLEKTHSSTFTETKGKHGDMNEKYMKSLYGEAERRNIRVFGGLNLRRYEPGVTWPCIGKNGKKGGVCWSHEEWLNKHDEWMKTAIEMVGDSPMFAGFYLDEPRFTGWCDRCQDRFREYLGKKYTHEELKELGIDDVDKVVAPFISDKAQQKVLWMEHQDFREESMQQVCRDIMDTMKSLKKDARLYVIINPDVSPAEIGQMVDVMGFDFYGRGQLEQAYFMDLYWSTAKGPMIGAVGAFVDRTAKEYERDLSTLYAHSDGGTPFHWHSVWKHEVRGGLKKKFDRIQHHWTPQNWDISRHHFGRMAKMEKYLVGTGSGAIVGIIGSDRTAVADPKGSKAGKDDHGLYMTNLKETYCALSYTGIQCNPFYADGMTAEMLAPYRVLIVSNARALDDDEIALIREWVRKGGVLIATGGTTILDRWARTLPDYSLADVFGVSYVGGVEEADWLELEVVEREGILSDGVFAGGKITCRAEGGYDVVKAGSGKVLAVLPDKNPAIVVNDFGNGKCVFLAVRYPGHGYMRRGHSIRDSSDFDSRVIDFMGGLVRGALKASGTEHPFTVSNRPLDTQVTMRVQPGRYIVHLENRDLELDTVKGVEVKVNLPVTRGVKVFYPDDNQKVKHSADSEAVSFTVRDFAFHEAVVIELGRGKWRR